MLRARIALRRENPRSRVRGDEGGPKEAFGECIRGGDFGETVFDADLCGSRTVSCLRVARIFEVLPAMVAPPSVPSASAGFGFTLERTASVDVNPMDSEALDGKGLEVEAEGGAC